MTRAPVGEVMMILGVALLIGGGWAEARTDAIAVRFAEHLSVGEGDLYARQAPDVIQSRLDDYKALGVGNVRLGFTWRELVENGSGKSTCKESSKRLRFLRSVKHNGLRLRLSIGAVKPPAAERGAMEAAGLLMKNRDGEYSPTLSVWHPGVPKIITEKTAQLFQCLADAGLLDALSAIIIPLGPAGEPVYPAAWMMNKNKPGDTTFWFYDRFARDDFVTQMKEQYGAVSRANEAWGTDYPDWSDVTIPGEGTRRGKMWRDVLIWYRDSKRRFIRWQIDHYRQLAEKLYPVGPKPDLVILMTGDRISNEEWGRAVERGAGSQRVKVMIDHEFLIDIAHEKGLVLQQAGIQDTQSLAATQDYIKRKGFQIRMWGENSRSEKRPGVLVDAAIKFRLFGLEYLKATDLYQANGHRTALYPAFEEAVKELRRYVANEVSATDGLPVYRFASLARTEGTPLGADAVGSRGPDARARSKSGEAKLLRDPLPRHPVSLLTGAR